MNDNPNDKGTGLLQRLQAHGMKPLPPLSLTAFDRMIAAATPPFDAGPDDDAETPRQRLTRKRKPTVASVIRQMKRAGVEVAACEINPRDGTVKVVSGKPVDTSHTDIDDTASPVDRSEWN